MPNKIYQEMCITKNSAKCLCLNPVFSSKVCSALPKKFFNKISKAALLVSLISLTLVGCHANLSLKPAISATQITHSGTIVDVISSDSSFKFKTLITALKAADLIEKLSSTDPFTLFAPTDAAFASLPEKTLEKLLKPENKASLQKILIYHLIPNAINSRVLKSGQVKTVEGSPVNININRGRITVERARVIQADIRASNGVIYVIDKVIIPPGLKL